MLQFVRRNIRQLKEILEEMSRLGYEIADKVIERLKVIEKIYEQQRKMYCERANQIKDRIVSLHQPQIRPICRGKAGKKTEFGPKGALTLVDEFLFLDKLSNNVFSEADTGLVTKQIDNFEQKFGKKPEYCTGDRTYGTRKNREVLKERDIRDAVKKLGRNAQECDRKDRWKKSI